MHLDLRFSVAFCSRRAAAAAAVFEAVLVEGSFLTGSALADDDDDDDDAAADDDDDDEGAVLLEPEIKAAFAIFISASTVVNGSETEANFGDAVADASRAKFEAIAVAAETFEGETFEA